MNDPASKTSNPILSLQQRWTDQLVRIHGDHAEYSRFSEKVGRVITVNQLGKALIDFADGAWYDIPASEEYLEILNKEEFAKKYDQTVNSAQSHPNRQG